MNDADPEIAVVLTAYAAFAHGDIDQAIAGLHPRQRPPGAAERVMPGGADGSLREDL